MQLSGLGREGFRCLEDMARVEVVCGFAAVCPTAAFICVRMRVRTGSLTHFVTLGAGQTISGWRIVSGPGRFDVI